MTRRYEVRDVVPLVITALNAIGWLVVYFLVLSPQAAENRAQTRLIEEQLGRLQGANQKVRDQLDVQEKGGRVALDDANRRLAEIQIARLDALTVRLEDQLASLRSRTQTTTDLNAVRQSLRPNMTFGKFDFKFQKKNVVDMEHEIRNIGTNAVLVSEPVVQLSRTAVTSSLASGDELVQGRDYVLRTYRLDVKAVNETAMETPLLVSDDSKFACDWSPDGLHVLYRSVDPATGKYDLMAVPVNGGKVSGTPIAVAKTPYDERDGQFYPVDGRWIAFQSDETIRSEIYVQRFPAGRKITVSSTGGTQPRWSADGSELYFLAADNRLMATPVRKSPDGELEFGTPQPLFATRAVAVGGVLRQQYVVAKDRQRFLIRKDARRAAASLRGAAFDGVRAVEAISALESFDCDGSEVARGWRAGIGPLHDPGLMARATHERELDRAADGLHGLGNAVTSSAGRAGAIGSHRRKRNDKPPDEGRSVPFCTASEICEARHHAALIAATGGESRPIFRGCPGAHPPRCSPSASPSWIVSVQTGIADSYTRD